MTRLSGDELRNGFVWNGFDYALQVWVVDGVVQRCGHPPAMARRGPCCRHSAWPAAASTTIPGAQRRRPTPGDDAASSETDHPAPPTEA